MEQIKLLAQSIVVLFILLSGCQNPSKGTELTPPKSDRGSSDEEKNLSEQNKSQICHFNLKDNLCSISLSTFNHLKKLSEQGFLNSELLDLKEIQDSYALKAETTMTTVLCIKQQYCKE